MWPFGKKESAHPGLSADLACLGKHSAAALRYVTSGKEESVLDRLGRVEALSGAAHRSEYLLDETNPAQLWRLARLYHACGGGCQAGWEPGLEPLEVYLQEIDGLGKVRLRLVVWMLESQQLTAQALLRSYLRLVGTPAGEQLEKVVSFMELFSEHPQVVREFIPGAAMPFLRHLRKLDLSPLAWEDDLFELLGQGPGDVSWEAYSWLERLGPGFQQLVSRRLGYLSRPARMAAVPFVARLMGPGPAADFLQRYANEEGIPEKVMELRKEAFRKRERG